MSQKANGLGVKEVDSDQERGFVPGGEEPLSLILSLGRIDVEGTMREWASQLGNPTCFCAPS